MHRRPATFDGSLERLGKSSQTFLNAAAHALTATGTVRPPAKKELQTTDEPFRKMLGNRIDFQIFLQRISICRQQTKATTLATESVALLMWRRNLSIRIQSKRILIDVMNSSNTSEH